MFHIHLITWLSMQHGFSRWVYKVMFLKQWCDPLHVTMLYDMTVQQDVICDWRSYSCTRVMPFKSCQFVYNHSNTNDICESRQDFIDSGWNGMLMCLWYIKKSTWITFWHDTCRLDQKWIRKSGVFIVACISTGQPGEGYEKIERAGHSWTPSRCKSGQAYFFSLD